VPDIERSKVRAMLEEAPEDQREPLLKRLKERGFKVVEDAADASAEAVESPGIAGRAWDAATAPLPVLGGVSDAVRTDIPGAIAEKAGELGGGPEIPVPGFLGGGSVAVGALPGIAGGMAMGMAGEVIPRSALDVGLLATAGPLGRGAGKMAMKALPPLEARAPNVVKAVKAALSADILPTVAQITQSKPAAALEEIASKIPYFGRRIEAMRAVQDQAYHELRGRAITGAGSKLPGSELGAKTQAAVSGELAATAAKREKILTKLHGDTLKKFGPSQTTEQIGKQLDDIRVAKTEEVRKVAGKLYEEAEEAIPPARNQVYDGNLRDTAAAELKKYENMPSASLEGKAKKLLEDLKSGPGNKIIENAADPIQAPDPLLFGASAQPEAIKAIVERKAYTFSEMQTLRSTLNGMIEQERMKVPPGQMTPEGAIYRRLKTSVDKDIASFSEGLPGDVKKKFDVATAFYRDHYKAVYANDTIASLGRVAKESPEDVYKMIVKPGDVNDIRRLKKVVGDSGFAPVRRKFVEGLITGEDGAVLSGHDVTKNLAKYGIDTLKEVLPPDQLKQVVKYTQTREMPKFLETEMERKLRGLIYQSKGVYRAPEDVVARVVDGDVATLRAVKNIVGREGVKPYKRAIIENILGSAPEPLALPGQAVTPTSLRIGKNLQAYDENFLKEIFTKAELDDIEKIDDIKALMESQSVLNANRSGTSSSLIANGMAGGTVTLMFLNPLKTVPIVISTDILTRLYTSEAGRKLLIKGLDPKFSRNTEVAGRLAAIIAQVQREKVNEDRALAGAVRK